MTSAVVQSMALTGINSPNIWWKLIKPEFYFWCKDILLYQSINYHKSFKQSKN